MTATEALNYIQAKDGNKVRHNHFEKSEYLYWKDEKVFDSNGCEFTRQLQPGEFNDWEVFEDFNPEMIMETINPPMDSWVEPGIFHTTEREILSTISIFPGSAPPTKQDFIFAQFENGFVFVGFFNPDTKDIKYRDRSYMFDGVKNWFSVPNECFV